MDKLPALEIPYRTRDKDNQEIIKSIVIKRFWPYEKNFVCPICNRESSLGFSSKEIVSANFTDWAYIGPYVCEQCANLFSLYFYNYIVDPNGIRLLNVRDLKKQLCIPQNPPFLFVITTSQKKHLFYRSVWNHDSKHFAVNLETETIYTTPQRMKELFDFVECLQTLGCSKNALKRGEIAFQTAQKIGMKTTLRLQQELSHSREIQIPLYCGQKRDITEEEAICCINSRQTA